MIETDFISNSVRVLPLGGVGDMGMNSMVVESENDLILIDCGVQFSDLDHFGVEFVVPEFSYVVERKDKFRGIVITHGHEDHIGALPSAIVSGLTGPIYATPFTKLLIEEKLREYGLLKRVKIVEYPLGGSFELGQFKIHSAQVNHSLIDCVSIAVDTPEGKIVHTGDFRFDEHPYLGQGTDEETLKRWGDEGVSLLLSDSTGIEVDRWNVSEKEVYSGFEKVLKEGSGLTIVAVFSSNIARSAMILELANQMGKKVVVTGRSLEMYFRLAEKSGFVNKQLLDQVCIPIEEIQNYPREQVIVITSGTQAEFRSTLMRVALGEHRYIHIRSGDRILMSSRFIPGNEKAISKMFNHMYRRGAEVIYSRDYTIHTSGHASAPELKKMLELIRPQNFVPVHGEYRFLVKHARLAVETGVEEARTEIIESGTCLQLKDGALEIIGNIEDWRKMLERADSVDLPRAILKERRKLAEFGTVFVFLVQDSLSGHIVQDPLVVSRGVAKPELIDEIEPKVITAVNRVLDEYESALDAGRADKLDLAEMVRIEVRRRYGNQLPNRPYVVPVVYQLDD